jgi:hypothetical protein
MGTAESEVANELDAILFNTVKKWIECDWGNISTADPSLRSG